MSRTRRSRCVASLVGLVFFVAATLATCVAQTPPPSSNILTNPGFEARTGTLPAGWTLDKRMIGKGQADIDSTHVHSGASALRLRPNASNETYLNAFNIGQGFQVASLRGQRLRVAGWLAAEGSAEAVLGVYVIDMKATILGELRLTQGPGTPGFRLVEGTFEVPRSGGAVLVVSLHVEGNSGAAYFDDVAVERAGNAVVLDPGQAERGATPAKLTARLTVDASRSLRQIPRTLYGQNLEWAYGGQLLWDFRNNSWNPDIIRLSKELAPTILRFPGGMMSDYYRWREGVGTPSKRPTVLVHPGGGKSPHSFGTDEALEFADKVGAELLITVNAHNGTPEEAADWVRYVNGQSGTIRPRVRFWEVGNEFYIKNDDPANAAIPPEEYVKRLRRFASAIKEADPRARVMAIGAENFGYYTSNAFPGWNRVVLTSAGDVVDYLGVHNAYFPTVFENSDLDLRTVYSAMLAAPLLIKRNLDTVAAQIGRYAPSRDIKIAITEWGPFFQLDPRNRYVHHVKTLGSALYVASVLKVFIESPRTEVANAFKLNGIDFMAWIGTPHSDILTRSPQEGQFIPTAPYYAMQLYTRHFGDVLIPSTMESPTFNTRKVGMVAAVSDVPYLDAISSRSSDGRTLYVLVVNKNFDNAIQTSIQLQGFRPNATATAWMLNGTSIDANTGTKPPAAAPRGPQAQAADNPRFERGSTSEVGITRTTVNGVSASFSFSFPPHSVTVLEIQASSVK